MDKKAMQRCVELGKSYLISRIDNGLCFEFNQLRHGPSWAWTTACVGSSLSEFGFVSKEMVEVILSLQHENGGWSYNPNVPTDADSTLRVIQFLRKIGLNNKEIIKKAENFVISHQQKDGGIATYISEEAESMGYEEFDGWCSSHPDVTALAVNQLRDTNSTKKAKLYLQKRLNQHNATSYWWKTPYYVLYESGHQNGYVVNDDSVEISLALLLKSKHGIYEKNLVQKIIPLQKDDGGFTSSKQFRIPRPNKILEAFTGKEEIVEDKRGIFSTCAAIVALERQKNIIY